MIPEERWMEIDGQKIRYFMAGSGMPVLLIHGLLGGSFCWRFVIPALAERRSVYAVDLPGSSIAIDLNIDCSMSRQAERVRRFIEQMGWTELSVVGSSFGGAIAMLLASQTQANVRSLVLSAPVNPWSDFGQGRIRFLSSVLGGYFLRMALPLSRPVHNLALKRMFGDPSSIPPDTLEGYRASVMRPGRAANVLTALRHWNQEVDAMRQIIPKLLVPVLLIWGTKDQAVDPRSAEKLRSELPNAELNWIEGAGHLPFEETPEKFNRVVLDFLDRTEGKTFNAEEQSKQRN
jgi:pimeloyl-ACP methyl ester carboxylesterase